MQTTYLTIAEACEKTGRSASTIRRLIKGIADDDNHADRAAIEPSPKEVAAFKKKNENFTWRVSEEIILKNFGEAPKVEKKEVIESKGAIMDILQSELALKNQQIEKQWEVIHALNDRLREGNILMGSLQKHFALPTAEAPVENVMEAATVASSKPSKETSSEAPRKRRFMWFGR
jgi:hypothetical protein